MNDEYKDLQSLLRLKKYEQPPQGFDLYTDRLVKEFHRRQRWGASRQSGLKRLWENIGEWMNILTVPRYAYVATIAVFGLIALAINGSNPGFKGGNVAAIVSPNSAVEKFSASMAKMPQALALNSPLDLSDLETKSVGALAAASSAVEPRYILEMRPASYSEPFSF